MDSDKYFNDKEFNSQFKGKSGIYVIEQELFSKKHKTPLYKVGYAKHSLHTRITDYRTHYGLIPFKIHALYCIPNVLGRRVNYAQLQEQVLHATLKEKGAWTEVGEWFYNLNLILSCIVSIKAKLDRIVKTNNWSFYINSKRASYLRRTKLVPEASIGGRNKDIIYGDGMQTRSKTGTKYNADVNYNEPDFESDNED